MIETYPGGAARSFGRGSHRLHASLEIHDPAVYPRLVKSRSVGLGTTYAEGLWDSDELLDLLLIARSIGRADPLRRRIAPLLIPLQRIGTLPILNTRRRARRHIASHYDAGNDMFQLFAKPEHERSLAPIAGRREVAGLA